MPRVEERRLQQLRGSSYVLTLPKEWVEELGLGKGSSVYLLAEPGLLLIVPGEKAGALSVDVELDFIGWERLEDVVKTLYKVGASQVRFRTRGQAQQLVGRLRRLRGEVHGLIVTAPNEDEAVGLFSDEVFATLEQGIRVLLMTLATAAQAAFKQTSQEEAGTLRDELADCRLYALALFRHVVGLEAKPSREMPIQAIPIAGVASARILDLCNIFEDIVTKEAPSDRAGVVNTFAELVSELTDALGGDLRALESLEEKISSILSGYSLVECRAYMLFKTLLSLVESLRELALLKTVLIA